jgi:2-polyprenyl-3-methyl-5-hydroxy-6-metoxy-1,4-benzoquinol methylase
MRRSVDNAVMGPLLTCNNPGVTYHRLHTSCRPARRKEKSFLRDYVRRSIGRVRKLSAGLPLGGEAVWPGERTDLFVAHESVYFFASQFAERRTVLDAACGTGYGSAVLARSAEKVIGVDKNRLFVRFAKRHFGAANLLFVHDDCSTLRQCDGLFDFIVSSNTLEHLDSPPGFLRRANELLRSGGRLLIVVPPIRSVAEQLHHNTNHFHKSNLGVATWHEMFVANGWQVQCFLHTYPGRLDFDSSAPSSANPDDFLFSSCELADLFRVEALSATFLLQRIPAAQ